MPITTANGGERTIMYAQTLYDLRQLTGFCSGTDLHKFFQRAIGDPSPAGSVEVPVTQDEIFDEIFPLLYEKSIAVSAMRDYGVNEEAIDAFLKCPYNDEALRIACQLDQEIEMAKP